MTDRDGRGSASRWTTGRLVALLVATLVWGTVLLLPGDRITAAVMGVLVIMLAAFVIQDVRRKSRS